MEPVFKQLFDFSSSTLFRVCLFQCFYFDSCAQIDVGHLVARRHDVSVVDVFDEGLDLGALDNGFLRHFLGHTTGVAIDSSNLNCHIKI